MKLTSTHTFPAPPDRVWALLMDTEAIAACLPGCKGLRPLGDDSYEAELVAGVAAVTGHFTARIQLLDLEAPARYRMRMEAKGRAGFVTGSALVTLTAEGEGTRVDVDAEADVGGTIARVGQRLLDGVAKMTTDRFFACMAGRA
jgi:carbon monoxide dehydrogenase subunit G